MLNAFTEDILCSSCNKVNTFTQETWAGILEDAVNEAPKFKPGEGQPSTIMRGEYNYGLMYGRQEPRCGKCKTGIDFSKIEEYSVQKHIKCSKCSNDIFVRKAPEIVEKSFPFVKYLVGENDDQLSANEKKSELPASAKPVLFTCPSCAGNLEIDGSDRMITCKFCSSEIYLPDDLWFRLHPAKSVERWYMLVDEIAESKGSPDVIPKWYYLPDICMDKAGNLYAASAVENDEDFMVWSLSPELKTRWIRRDLKFKYEKTGLTVTNDGNLYLWNEERHSLLKLSSADGTTLSKINGRPVTDEDPYAFNLMGCTSLVSDTDDSILALINNEIVRFDIKGKRIELWAGKKFGLFSAGIGNRVPENDSEYAPYAKEIKSFPKRVDSDLTGLSIGWDGYLYMIDRSSSDGVLVKFDKDGSKLWSKYIPLGYKDCKPGMDSEGNLYILGRTENSNTNLIRLNISTFEFKTLLKDIKEGGVLNEEMMLAVAPDGTIYIMDTYDKLKVFDRNLEMKYRSKQAEEDDELEKRRKKDKIENDEEFS